MHRSKLGSGGASGIGASSSSSDGSVMAHSTGSLGAGSGSICFANKSPVACSSFDFSTASRQSSSLSAQATPPGCPRRVLLAQVRDCARCPFGRRLAPPCFVHDHVVEFTVEERAGQRRGRLRLDAALEAAEEGHVAGLQVRSASWSAEAQPDMREIGLRGRQGGLTGVDAGKIVRSIKKND